MSNLNFAWLSHKIILVLTMIMIGFGTLFAAINTYEVVTRTDLPYTDIVKTLEITENQQTQDRYIEHLSTNFDEGVFGIPKKIKLPESTRHIDIVEAHYEDGWVASKGIGQTFVSDNKRQKVFGEATIYIRTNTATTSALGEVYNGDVINIVTTEGWQLGYEVNLIAQDPAALENSQKQTKLSEIVVVLIDDRTGDKASFLAELTKVGERI